MTLNVAVVTGTRAEFGIWQPVLRTIRRTPGLRLQLVVTGAHLLKKFGHTVDDLSAQGFPIAATVPMYRGAEPPAASLARATAGMAAVFRRLKTDIVLVLGDRLEILAAANAALAEQLLIGHVHGGETAPGQWDEQIRHAVTKLAHVHFAATKTAGARIVQMGEDPRRVFVVGAPALDDATHMARTIAQTVAAQFPAARRAGISPLLALHPTSPDDDIERRRALLVVRTLRRFFPGEPVFTTGPNNDPGHRGILAAYRQLAGEVDLVMSSPQRLFWSALAARRLLVGNSSSGIIEAATFGCAVINIGSRQGGRERSGNVIDADFTAPSLAAAIRRVLSDKTFARAVARRKNIYGDGHASERICRALLQIARRPPSVTKVFHDLP